MFCCPKKHASVHVCRKFLKYLFLGHPVLIWDTLYLFGTPCTYLGHPVLFWDTLYLSSPESDAETVGRLAESGQLRHPGVNHPRKVLR